MRREKNQNSHNKERKTKALTRGEKNQKSHNEERKTEFNKSKVLSLH
jgi:hypothetical protein